MRHVPEVGDVGDPAHALREGLRRGCEKNFEAEFFGSLFVNCLENVAKFLLVAERKFGAFEIDCGGHSRVLAAAGEIDAVALFSRVFDE